MESTPPLELHRPPPIASDNIKRPRRALASGIAPAGQLTHRRNALRRFTLVRNHNAPMASFRHVLTEAPQRQTGPPWTARELRAAPLPVQIS